VKNQLSAGPLLAINCVGCVISLIGRIALGEHSRQANGGNQLSAGPLLANDYDDLLQQELRYGYAHGHLDT
jgi:hypothetical protein